MFVTPTQLSDSLATVPTNYTADGTLTADRTITGGAFTLSATGSMTGSNSVFSATNSSSGRGVVGTSSSGTGVFGQSGTGLAASFNSTAGQAMQVQSDVGLAADIRSFSSTANVPLEVLRITSATSTGNALPGHGGAISFYHDKEDAGFAVEQGSRVESVLVNGNTGDFSAKMNFQTSFDDTIRNVMTLQANEPVILSQYGSGTFTGTPAKYLAVTATGETIEVDTTGFGGGAANLAYTGAADVIELDAGGTSVFIAEGSGVDVTQSGDTLTITGKGTRFVQDSITGATLTVDLNEAPTAIISLKMTTATSVTLTISNPYGFLTDDTAPTYEGETGVYTFRFWGISGTDNVTWPANFYDMNGTALGTDALVTGTAYTCYYDPLANEYYCK